MIAQKKTIPPQQSAHDSELMKLTEENGKLVAELEKARESERRALADYQNVVRRNREERAYLVKFAAQDLVERLLEPLGHLSMAAQQLNDNGLNMVVDRLWHMLNEEGLQEIEVLGEPFDVETMEVVETEGSGNAVVKVIRKGYKYHDRVIQHAKVVLGDS